LRDKDWQSIVVGKQPVVYAFDMAVFEAAPKQLEDEENPLIERRLQLTADIEIVAAGQPTVALNTDPAVGEQVKAAITLDRLSLQPWGPNDSQKYNIRGSFFVKPRPVDIAFEVFLRRGEEEVPCSSMSVEKSKETAYGLGWVKLPESFVGKKVDVVLRPSIDVASKSVDCFEIWGEEVIFADVLVERKE